MMTDDDVGREGVKMALFLNDPFKRYKHNFFNYVRNQMFHSS